MPTPANILGIDFGTSTTLIAEASGVGRAAVVPVGWTRPWLPSVATEIDGALVVGEKAETQSPGRLIHSVKRSITERSEKVTSEDGTLTAIVDDVIGAVLLELASRARDNGLDIGNEHVVRFGCPAMWDADQRRRLLDLAQSAGFAVGASTLIDEPIAAGLMWITEQQRARNYLDNDRVLVFDMGGGTLDVAVLDVSTGPGTDPQIYVLASQGISRAGDVLDKRIAVELETLLLTHGIHVDRLRDPILARAYLRRAAMEAKVALSAVDTATFRIGYDLDPLPELQYSVGQLNATLRPQMSEAWGLVVSTLRAALLTAERQSMPKDLRSTSGIRAFPEQDLVGAVDHVVLVGGMTLIPGVAEYLSPKFTRARIHQFSGTAPQEAVVAGLAERDSYEQVNLHLPGFDFVLDIPGAESVTLYRAHTPFYRPWQAHSWTKLAYSWPDGQTAYHPECVRTLPTSGAGILRVIALDGSVVTMRGNDEDTDGLRVNFGFREPRFTLAPDGSMTFIDGFGNEQILRIERWPALRSGFGVLAVRVEEKRWTPEDRRSWDTK